jgi:hypothetical protein
LKNYNLFKIVEHPNPSVSGFGFNSGGSKPLLAYGLGVWLVLTEGNKSQEKNVLILYEVTGHLK